jgi:hypothetical protein
VKRHGARLPNRSIAGALPMHCLRTGRGVIGDAHQAGAYSLGLGLERYLNRTALPNFPALATVVSLQEISGYDDDGKLERPISRVGGSGLSNRLSAEVEGYREQTGRRHAQVQRDNGFPGIDALICHAIICDAVGIEIAYAQGSRIYLSGRTISRGGLKSAVAIAHHYHDARTSIHVDEVEFAVAADVACDKLAAKLERRIRINGILEGIVTVTHQEGDSVVRLLQPRLAFRHH